MYDGIAFFKANPSILPPSTHSMSLWLEVVNSVSGGFDEIPS